ncbi:MAG: integrase [Bacteroidetes bacterium]|nr:MAG: integrase [Bacteroidota bacterium]
MNNAAISIYLDTRHKKANGCYPIKLRVYNPVTKKTKLYPFTKIKSEINNKADILKIINEGFTMQLALDKIQYSNKPRGTNLKLKFFLNECMHKSSNIAESLHPFSFEKFEKEMFDNIPANGNLSSCYQTKIEVLENHHKIGTASNYKLSKKSLDQFASTISKEISFNSITPDFLESYERYMLDELERSETTVSMYLRALRAVYNKAIDDKIIFPEQYPFGKYKYTIPTGDKVIKALTKEQLASLFNGIPKTLEQQKAKDYWFFSFYAQGMNIKDIALLKFQDVKEDSIQYTRAKTKNTGRKKQKIIYITMNEYILDFIKRYKTLSSSPKDHIFPILTKGLSPHEQHKKVKSFTRYINQHFRKYAILNGINEAVSTYWARHSFTNTLINNGASIEFASEALNHSDIRTTQNYVAGFEENRKKEMMKELLKFQLDE